MVAGMDIVPFIFIIGGIGVAVAGGYLLNASKKVQRNFEDEIQ